MIFSTGSPEAVKARARTVAPETLAVVDRRLEGRDVLVGDAFSAADAYLFWALTLMPPAGIPVEPYPSLRRYYGLHRTRLAVREALAFEKEQLAAPFVAAAV